MNTPITERQRIQGVISGTSRKYINSSTYPAWFNIVEQFKAGATLTEAQVSLLEAVNSQASWSRSRQKHFDNFDHSLFRLPRTIRG